MTSATMTMGVSPDWGKEFLFVQSESKAVGLNGSLMDAVRNNAPRISAGLKLAADLTLGLSLNPWLMGYTAFAGVGRILLLIYGTKANQKKVAAEQSGKPPEATPGFMQKVMSPRQYPVESSAGLSTLGEISGMGYGISRFMGSEGGYTPLILGVFAIWSYVNILFGKEKKAGDKAEDAKSESLTFEKSESKAVGLTGRLRNMMKGNPVLVSSLMQLGISFSMLAGGILEAHPVSYIVAASIFIVANTLQALFVRKNEFNIEGAQAQKEKPATFEDKLMQRQRGQGPDRE